MRIPCPYCGSRDIKEFASRGEVHAAPGLDADFDPAFAALYLRDNSLGRTREYFYHAQGCRSWLVVERDVRTHEIFSAALASQRAQS